MIDFLSLFPTIKMVNPCSSVVYTRCYMYGNNYYLMYVTFNVYEKWWNQGN